MHKPFYASGFLYNSVTQQILLQQNSDKSSPQHLSLSGKNRQKEQPQAAFQRIVQKLLKVQLKPAQICAVYDYYHSGLKANNYVFYAEVRSKSRTIPSNFSWFTFKQISKLPLDVQTRQDLIVTERVIKAHARDQAAIT